MKKKLLMICSIFALITVLTACGGEKDNKENGAKDDKTTDTIKIATKPMTEQLILGEMLSILIEENTDLETEVTKGIGGGTANIHPAMLNGDFDLYPEYTGTSWYSVLKKTEIPDHETMYAEIKKTYNDEFDLKWLGLYGFENTYGIIASKDVIDKYGLTKISDLEKAAPELTFGANPDYFERPDGFEAFKNAYNLNFDKTLDMDIALRFQALDSGEIDVSTLFTTDAQLSITEHKILEDDKKFFQDYYAGTIIRNETLKKHPELEKVIALLDGQISEQEMAKMNYEVEINEKDEKDVAKEFLTAKGILK